MKYPKHYSKLNNCEQALSFAGSKELDMSKSYLKKSVCNKKAKELIDSGQVTGMTQSQIAEEIYAHAFCYYASSILIDAGIDPDAVKSIKSKAEKIYIGDGGDSTSRMTIYFLIYAISEPAVI